MRAAVLLCAALVMAACARPVERGEALYQDGRYVEAAETFEIAEARLAGMPAEACAAFGLYRGLTFLRLGDVASARRWLAYAYSIERRSPGVLPAEQRRALDAGWAELEGRTAPPGSSADAPSRRMAAAPAPSPSAPVAPASKRAPAPALQ